MEEGLRKLYTGDFNSMNQEVQPDGSIIITLNKRGEDKTYKFRIKNLYQENEEVMEHEIRDTRAPKFVLDRMKQARKEIQGGGQ